MIKSTTRATQSLENGEKIERLLTLHGFEIRRRVIGPAANFNEYSLNNIFVNVNYSRNTVSLYDLQTFTKFSIDMQQATLDNWQSCIESVMEAIKLATR